MLRRQPANQFVSGAHSNVTFRVESVGSFRPQTKVLSGTFLGASMGVWITLYPFADLTLRSRIYREGGSLQDPGAASPLLTAVYAVIVGLGMFPVLACAIRFGVDFRRARYFAIASLLILASIPLSLTPLSDLSLMNYVVLIDFVFAVLIIALSTNLDREEVLRAFFLTTAFMLSLAMAAALIDHDYAWGRFMGRTAPNYWGAVAMMTIICCIAVRSRFLWIIPVGLSLYVLHEAQSRADLMAIAASLSVVAVLFTRTPRARRWGWLWGLAALALILAIAFGSDFIANKIFLLSDQNRGLGSGMTGRTGLNWEAWTLFSEHPWLGVGYRQHEALMSTHYSVHSVYLATLADTGLVGFIGYVVFFFPALFRALAEAWHYPTRQRMATAAYLTAFTVLGVVEPTGVHTGNTLSMFMIMGGGVGVARRRACTRGLGPGMGAA